MGPQLAGTLVLCVGEGPEGRQGTKHWPQAFGRGFWADSDTHIQVTWFWARTPTLASQNGIRHNAAAPWAEEVCRARGQSARAGAIFGSAPTNHGTTGTTFIIYKKALHLWGIHLRINSCRADNRSLSTGSLLIFPVHWHWLPWECLSFLPGVWMAGADEASNKCLWKEW